MEMTPLAPSRARRRRHGEAYDARAQEARGYVRRLVAERGRTKDVERDALGLVAAALAADLGVRRDHGL
jgi:hypothetical protein